MELFTGLALVALFLGVCRTEHRRTKRQDRELVDFYEQHLSEVLVEETTDEVVLLGVFERLAEFGAEVDVKLRAMEERLRSQESNLRAQAAENRRLQREVRWCVTH